ncbi:MAG: hypothetical protein L0312_24560 [Acidobacteria bacterium]|nr:hypothetical protein [Acidobacteriota bacterium]
MNQQQATLHEAEKLWSQYVAAHKESERIRYQLLGEYRPFAIEVIQRALLLPIERFLALQIASQLQVEEIKQLLPQLVAVATHVCGDIVRARELLLALPHSWLLENIESAAEPLLAVGDYEDYFRFIELYELIDKELANRLARRAAESTNPEIRAAGEEFLGIWESR